MLSSSARFIHAWMGAILALLLILIASTGTALIWKDAYVRLAFAQQAQGLDRNVNDLLSIVESSESAFGAHTINHIRFGDENVGISRIDLVNKHAAYIAADGSVLEEWAPNGRPEDWLLDLHHRLLSGTAGLYVVGAAGLASLLMILAGLVAYWPKRRHWRVGLIPRKLIRPHILLSHRNLGFLSSLPFAIVLLSGVVITFPDTSRSFFYSPESDTYGADFGEGVDALDGQSEAVWERALGRAMTVFPQAHITGLVWPSAAEDKVIQMRTTSEWAEHGNSRVHITAFDGMMGLRVDASTSSLGEKAYQAMRTVHTGGFDGWLYDVFLSIIGIGMTYIGLSGFTTFISHRLPRSRRKAASK
ncbi:PepSY-associated TM helix domain-containing protein [Granulosicoccus antarcticus]|uniref:PepSY domain-containing protein n=1 Tax=Granulosicoccus antarcticus IMCC3135 TaxID=1192854 RepID=A0A2Z2NML1_9GAMM|nr:PepSY-associated TM helix domain-containing protein [Granulosicoccus antarcticus]ASJ72616.1 hypothetical protein IMCC3135_12640 [Granulosicoccus antarcticus IMCC3135]